MALCGGWTDAGGSRIRHGNDRGIDRQNCRGPISRWLRYGERDRLLLWLRCATAFQPSRAPELNPVDNGWQFLRANWLFDTVFDGIRAYHLCCQTSLEQSHCRAGDHPIHPSHNVGLHRCVSIIFGINGVLHKRIHQRRHQPLRQM